LSQVLQESCGFFGRFFNSHQFAQDLFLVPDRKLSFDYLLADRLLRTRTGLALLLVQMEY
jgi:hypothetical protein